MPHTSESSHYILKSFCFIFLKMSMYMSIGRIHFISNRILCMHTLISFHLIFSPLLMLYYVCMLYGIELKFQIEKFIHAMLAVKDKRKEIVLRFVIEEREGILKEYMERKHFFRAEEEIYFLFFSSPPKSFRRLRLMYVRE